MFITTIQIIAVSFVVGLIVGIIVGWKLTLSLRMAKIQELQVELNRLKKEKSELRSQLFDIRYNSTKESVENFVSDTKNKAGSFVGGIKNKLFGTSEDKQLEKQLSLPKEKE